MLGRVSFVSFGKILMGMLLGAMLVPCSAAPEIVEEATVIGDSKIDNKDGLKFIYRFNEQFWCKLGGYIHLEESIFSGSEQDKGAELPNGGLIRRAFILFGGGIGSNIEYAIDVSFETNNQEQFQNAWLMYYGPFNTRYTVGLMTPLSPLENQTSNNDFMLVETSMGSSAFANTPGTAIGILGQISLFDTFTFSAMVHQPQQNDDNFNSPGRPDRVGEEIRLTYVPVHTDDRVYHFGLFARYQGMNHTLGGSGQILQRNLFFTFPEALPRNALTLKSVPPLVNSGNLRARSFDFLAAELGFLYGPFTLQSEYHYVDVQRLPRIGMDDINNIHFNAWYVEGGYILTGESRGYNFDDGLFDGVKPSSPCGAWEVVLRLSAINMIDRNVYGGSEQNITVGLNWFANNNVRFIANYIKARINPTDVHNPGTAPAIYHKRLLDIFSIRMQMVF